MDLQERGTPYQGRKMFENLLCLLFQRDASFGLRLLVLFYAEIPQKSRNGQKGDMKGRLEKKEKVKKDERKEFQKKSKKFIFFEQECCI